MEKPKTENQIMKKNENRSGYQTKILKILSAITKKSLKNDQISKMTKTRKPKDRMAPSLMGGNFKNISCKRAKHFTNHSV